MEMPWIGPMADIGKRTLTKERYLVDQLLSVGGNLLLHGTAGSGKSTLVLHLAASLATGTPFLDTYAVPRPQKVMVLQAEMSLYDLKDHFDAIRTIYPSLGRKRRQNLVTSEGAAFREARSPERLADLLRELGIEVLVIDPFSSYFTGKSLDDALEVRTALDRLSELADVVESLKAVVVVHHSPKAWIANGRSVQPATPAGSYGFEAWPSTLMRLEAPARESHNRTLVVVKSRAPRLRQNASLEISLTDDGYVLRNPHQSNLRTEGQDPRLRRLEAFLAPPDGATRSEVMRALQLRKTELDCMLADFGVRLETREEPSGGRPGTRYVLKQ